MKLVKNWQEAHKALYVILPTLGSVVMLLLYTVQKAGELELIPNEYLPVVTTVVIPFLAWLGRVIPQVNLALGKLAEQKEETQNEF